VAVLGKDTLMSWFGLLEKKTKINVRTVIEEVDIVVRGVTRLLEPQLALLLSTPHLQGFLMGTLDAAAQRMVIPSCGGARATNSRS
jgi:hypothetical protein